MSVQQLARVTLTDVIYKITYFQQNNASMKAVEMAIEHAKQHMGETIIMFTDSELIHGTLYLKIIYTDKWIAFNDTLLIDFPHPFYAFFICRGFYIEHVTTDDLPQYCNKTYTEDDNDSNSDEKEWLIKSIRNVVFHEPKDNIAAIMLLCDWEVDKNKGVWIEEPTDASEISWIALHNLNNYYVLEQYFKFRCPTLDGATKHCNNIAHVTETDMDTYLNHNKK